MTRALMDLFKIISHWLLCNYKQSDCGSFNSGLDWQLFYDATQPRMWEKPMVYELQPYVATNSMIKIKFGFFWKTIPDGKTIDCSWMKNPPYFVPARVHTPNLPVMKLCFKCHYLYPLGHSSSSELSWWRLLLMKQVTNIANYHGNQLHTLSENSSYF